MENSESKTNKNGLWNFLFGKKKKNAFQKKKNCNHCENCQGEKKDKTVQTNNNSDDKEDEDIPILNINTYSNPKEIFKKNCPGKVFPSERRGCGFHLYFCIDSMQNSDTSKSKKNKNTIYEINKAEDFQSLEVGQRSAAGDNEVNRLSGQTSSPLKYPSTMSILNKKVNLSGTKMAHNGAMGDQLKNTTIKVEENIIEKEINTSPKNQEENKFVNKSNTRQVKNTSSKMLMISNLQHYRNPSNISLKMSIPVNGEQTSKVPTVRISSVERYSVPETKNFKNEEKGQIDCHKSLLLPDQNEEAIFKGLEILRKQKLRRKSSMKSKTGNTFVRNSLISIRKERLSSIDTMVPQILLKLNHIEDKISELEKVYEGKGKNIMNIVGISCNNAKSTLSIDAKDQDGKNCQSSPETSPKTNTTVVIKSRGEDIVVNAPENISVTKKRNKQESNQLIYHNTQELDAHSIASYSRAIKSQKPKSDVEASSQTMGFTNSQASDKWRRISEELKFN